VKRKAKPFYLRITGDPELWFLKTGHGAARSWTPCDAPADPTRVNCLILPERSGADL
jgi:hypothetical protein